MNSGYFQKAKQVQAALSEGTSEPALCTRCKEPFLSLQLEVLKSVDEILPGSPDFNDIDYICEKCFSETIEEELS